MPIANVWDATASGGAGAWVPAIIGVQGYQGAQGPQGYQGSQGYQGISGTAGTISPLTTKGDVYTFSTTQARLPVGNEGESIVALPASGTGVGYFPAQVNIQKLTLGGHSYTDNFSGYDESGPAILNTLSISGTTGKYYNTSQSMYSHLVSALDFDSANVHYMGVAGTVLQYDLSFNTGISNGVGGWVNILRGIQPARYRKPYTNDNGLCIGFWGINDMGLSSATVQNITTDGTNWTVSLNNPCSFAPGQQIHINYTATGTSSYSGTYYVNSVISTSGFTIANSLQPSDSPTNLSINSWAGTLWLPPFIDALRTVVSRFRASTVSKSFSGVPRTVSSTQVNSGDSYQSFLSGDVFYIYLPNDYDGSTVALNFIGGGNYGSGGTVSITNTVSGVPSGPLTINGVTTNLFTTSGYNLAYPNGVSPRVGQVARINGLTAASGSILTVSGVGVNSVGATIDWDSWQIESSFPNPVVIANVANIGYSNYTDVQSWNTAIQNLVNEFPSPIAVANIQDLLTTGNNRIAYDNIHPSELGGIYIAEEVRKSYTRMKVPLRSFVSSTSNNIKSGLSQYPMASLRSTRTFGSSSTNSINIGQTGLTPLGTWSIASNVTSFTPQYLAPIGATTYFIPIVIPEPCSITKFTSVGTTGSTGTIGFGLYYDWLGLPSNLIYDTGTTSANTSGNKSISLDSNTPLIVATPGVYWIAMYLQGTGAQTNMRVAALTGSDPKIVNFDSSTLEPSGSPNGCCLYIAAPSTTLPFFALGSAGTVTPPTTPKVLNWSPQVYITVQGNY